MTTLILLSVLALCLKSQTQMMYSGPSFKVYDPDADSLFYINDHTFILGTTWNIIGITHTNPADAPYEVNLGHGSSNSSVIINATNFHQEPFILGSKAPETHQWAPHILDVTSYGYNCNTQLKNDMRCYIMVYCGGGAEDPGWAIRGAYSTDLYEWKRIGTFFTENNGTGARDPMLFYDEQTKYWHLYYTINNYVPTNKSSCVLMRENKNLFDPNSWSTEPIIALNVGPDNNAESSFVIRRGTNYYICSGPWFNYTTTRCWYSNNSLNFGSVPEQTAVEAGRFGNQHAAEIVRDSNGKWYISGCGWGQGGVYLAPLYFNDGKDNASTSMPPPIPPKIPNRYAFDTNLVFAETDNQNNYFYNSNEYWNILPPFSYNIFGGNPMNNTFLMTKNKTTSDFDCTVVFNVETSDGNPATGNYNKSLIRDGTAAAIIFGVTDFDNTNTISSAYGVNLFLNNHLKSGGGIKFFKFSPYKEYVIVNNADFDNDIWYSLRIQFLNQNKNLNVYLNDTLIINNYAVEFDGTLLNGYLGLNVWQGFAIFNQFKCK